MEGCGLALGCKILAGELGWYLSRERSNVFDCASIESSFKRRGDAHSKPHRDLPLIIINHVMGVRSTVMTCLINETVAAWVSLCVIVTHLHRFMLVASLLKSAGSNP